MVARLNRTCFCKRWFRFDFFPRDRGRKKVPPSASNFVIVMNDTLLRKKKKINVMARDRIVPKRKGHESFLVLAHLRELR